MEPSWLIGSKNQAFENRENPLKPLGRAYNNHSLHEHSLRGIMPKGEISIRIVGNVQVR